MLLSWMGNLGYVPWEEALQLSLLHRVGSKNGPSPPDFGISLLLPSQISSYYCTNTMVLCSQFVRDDISDTFLHSPHHHLSWKRCIMWVVLQGNAGKKELKASAAHLLLSCFHSILCTRGSNMSYFYWANVVMLNAAFIMVLMMLCCHAGLILDGESNAATCHNKWREVVNTEY